MFTYHAVKVVEKETTDRCQKGRELSRGWPVSAHPRLWCLWSMSCNYNPDIGTKEHICLWWPPDKCGLQIGLFKKNALNELWMLTLGAVKSVFFYRLEPQCHAKGQLAHLGAVWKSLVSAAKRMNYGRLENMNRLFTGQSFYSIHWHCYYVTVTDVVN